MQWTGFFNGWIAKLKRDLGAAVCGLGKAVVLEEALVAGETLALAVPAPLGEILAYFVPYFADKVADAILKEAGC